MGIEEVILEAVKEESFEKGMEKGREEGMEKGIEKGEQKKSLEIALRMKKAGFSTADIVKATGLTQAQIKKLS
jgi:predicted transposase/invertase (TIGR01784 family)